MEKTLGCLEALCVNTESFSEDILNAGGVPVLVSLLCSDRQVVQCMATAVLCHMTENSQVCEELVHHGAVPILIKLLSVRQPELDSRCAVILADLAAHSKQHQSLIADLGGVALVVNLLTSDLQDVLVNGVRCIRTLCVRSPHNQTAVAHAGGVPHLIQILAVDSDTLQEEACLALAELSRGHRENQALICEAGAVGALVQALRHRKISVKVKAASALESLASHNSAIQQCFLRQSAPKYLLQLLTVFQLDVREQGAIALWALAGQSLNQQKLMAEQMGYSVILDLLLSPSDKIQYVGCRAVIALSRDSRIHQNGFCRENGVPPLVRLLRGSRTGQKTLLSVIEALGCLCIGVALTTNKNSQKTVYREQAIPTLLELLKAHKSQEIKNISLDAGHALSLFAYNSKAHQKAIRQLGGIPGKIYETFLNSDNETEKAKAAFQTVVLARVISGSDEVTLTARGVTILVELLQSDQSTTVIITAQLLASLAHMRAGITDAIVSMGAIEHLSAHLDSEDEEVRTACTSTLGYLTFNRYAHRQLMTKCRKSPHIYDLLMENLAPDARISQLFTAEFERQRRIGFPSLSLEINGGPPVSPGNNKGPSKKLNTRGSQSAVGERETSAPSVHHVGQRTKSAHPKFRPRRTPCQH
nr:novel protein [Danio rerio]